MNHKTILNVQRINENNAGDISCTPVDYFYLANYVEKFCIEKIIQGKSCDYFLDFSLLIGGGGLFYLNEKANWQQFFEYYVKNKNKKAVVWGAGLNHHKKGRDARYPEFIHQFDLVGVRDFVQGIRWVPCVSCMHKIFDVEHKIKHKIVVFEHPEVQIKTQLPKFTNNKTIEEAVSFLGSAECVFTNTYHGVYWATLLNKKVIAMPIDNSTRFYFFKHPPLIVDKYTEDFSKCVNYEKALQECRQSNQDFYDDFLKLFKMKIY
jgi:hypothetical protein